MNTKISAKEIVRRTGEKILTSKQPGTRDIWTKQWLKMEPTVLEKVQKCILDINYLYTWSELPHCDCDRRIIYNTDGIQS